MSYELFNGNIKLSAEWFVQFWILNSVVRALYFPFKNMSVVHKASLIIFFLCLGVFFSFFIPLFLVLFSPFRNFIITYYIFLSCFKFGNLSSLIANCYWFNIHNAAVNYYGCVQCSISVQKIWTFHRSLY